MKKYLRGVGLPVMGNPINAVLWLANTMALTKYPLRAGRYYFKWCAWPMVEVNAGDNFEARISGLGSRQRNVLLIKISFCYHTGL